MKKMMLVALLVFTLCSCGESEPDIPASAPTQITVIVKRDYNNTFKNLVRKFEESNPDIKVKIQHFPLKSDDMHRIVVSDLVSRQNEFDLFEIEDIWIEEFALKNYILDISPYNLLGRGDYINQVRDSVCYDGRTYAVPFEMDTGLIFYRKDIAENETWDWERMADQARGFEDAHGGMRLFAIPGADSDDILCHVLELIQYKDGDIIKGLELCKRLINTSKNDAYGNDDYLSAFKAGDAAYIRSWASSKPLLGDELSKVKSVMGIKPIPLRGGKPVNLLKVYAMAVSGTTERFDEALRFLRFCANRDNQALIIKGRNTLPMLESFYRDPLIIDYCPYITEIRDALPLMQTRNRTKSYVENAIAAKKAFHKFIEGEITAEEAEKTFIPLAAKAE